MEVVLRSFTMVLKQSPGSKRTPMVGTLDEVREDMQRLREVGVTHLIQSPPAIGFDPSATVADMISLMEELISR
jgi:alkanesulfonate monooxygenase SsuD/methylene tetrahydromethanopterin reductase-like flavin-dependent oxidoreductase (luciferase family)